MKKVLAYLFHFFTPCPIEVEEVKPPAMEECPKCGVKLEAFYLRHSHRCEGTD